MLTLAGCLAAGGLGTYLYASRVEARRYRIERVNVITGGANADKALGNATGDATVERASPHLDPEGLPPINLKILHLSDLHLSWPESHKMEFLSRVTNDDYDMVILTGDVFENYSGLPYAGSILSRRPRLGAYAVLGNHDYYDYTWFHKTFGRMVRRFRHPPVKREVGPLIDALENGGFKVMRNSSLTLAQERVHIVGIDYPGIAENDLRKLVAQAPEDHFVLSLLHVPHALESLMRAGVHLALGGHTHGGQVRVPLVGALLTDSELPRHEASGLLWRGETAIHISRGIGADPKTNFRLFCPPTATILQVRHQARRSGI